MTSEPLPSPYNDYDQDDPAISGPVRHVNRNRTAQATRRDTRGRGHSAPPATRTAIDARDHIRRLRAEGGTYRSIADAAGLTPATVHDLATGRRTPTPATTRAVTAVASASLHRARVDAGGTRLRLRALHVMGHSSARIARALGAREMTIRAIVRGDAPTVSTTLRDRAADLYDAWWDKRAPGRTRAERGAATTARRRAIRGNWCAGAGLDDDDLDTPGYKPTANWKPAAGTGTAPDIHPPNRPGKNRHNPRHPVQEGSRPWA